MGCTLLEFQESVQEEQQEQVQVQNRSNASVPYMLSCEASLCQQLCSNQGTSYHDCVTWRASPAGDQGGFPDVAGASLPTRLYLHLAAFAPS